jgi:S-adenosylmethionine:tRNA ribosyltransferase-isomerase
VRVADFHFELLEELIAQHPPVERGSSRMLVLDREKIAGDREQGEVGLVDAWFRDLPGFLRAGDLLVLNDSRVLPARLFATREGLTTQASSPAPSGVVEVLLTEEVDGREQGTVNGEQGLVWRALVRPARKVGVGERLEFRAAGDVVLTAEVVAAGDFGERTLRFAAVEDFYERVGRIGHMPLPPYIRRKQGGRAGREANHREHGERERTQGRPAAPNDVESEDRERYQTVYAQEVGSAAAPTAGLHFTPEILAALEARGVEVRYVTLHVGLGTFQPVRVSELKDIRLHSERYTLPAATAEALNRARAEGRRVVAVGTTTTRTLEHIAAQAAEAGEEHTPGAKAPAVNEPLVPGLKSRPISETPRSISKTSWPISETSRLVSETNAGGVSGTGALGASEEPRTLQFRAHSGSTSIFIGPGYRFRVVGGLLTNFHLPESTLLMLVSAFAGDGDRGRQRVLAAYAHAVREGYRFYSYGDCMLVV